MRDRSADARVLPEDRPALDAGRGLERAEEAVEVTVLDGAEDGRGRHGDPGRDAEPLVDLPDLSALIEEARDLLGAELGVRGGGSGRALGARRSGDDGRVRDEGGIDAEFIARRGRGSERAAEEEGEEERRHRNQYAFSRSLETRAVSRWCGGP